MNKAIYLDAGAWQSRKGKLPSMDFAIVEHNFIALCTYFIGNRHNLTHVENNKSFNYEQSKTHKLLTILFDDKTADFKKKVVPVKAKQTSQFISKYMTFEKNSLLTENDKLLIIIPDLHLHFFKNTICDNFCVWHREIFNEKTNSFITRRLEKRSSMEGYFSNFLKGILSFQKKYKKTEVFFVGDIYEMWETNALINAFCINSDFRHTQVD